MSETAEMPIIDNECPFRHELNPYSNLGDSTARTNYFIFQAGMKTGFREAEEELTKLRAALDESIKVIQFYGSQSSWMGYHRNVDIIASSDCSPDKSREDDFDIMLGGRRAREFLSKHSELIKGEV